MNITLNAHTRDGDTAVFQESGPHKWIRISDICLHLPDDEAAVTLCDSLIEAASTARGRALARLARRALDE